MEEGNEYRRILPAGEDIMKNENDKWSLGSNKTHKRVAVGGRQGVRTAETMQVIGGASATTRLTNR